MVISKPVTLVPGDMDGEIIGTGLADRGRRDLDQPEHESDFGDLVQHAAAGAPDILHDANSALMRSAVPPGSIRSLHRETRPGLGRRRRRLGAESLSRG